LVLPVPFSRTAMRYMLHPCARDIFLSCTIDNLLLMLQGKSPTKSK
jgi:hypothetical protein